MNGNFDSVTGEQTQGNGTAVPPVSGTGAPGKKKKGWLIALAAVVVVAAGAVFAAAKSGVFMSDSAKVLAAVTNTLNDTDYLTGALKLGSLSGADSYTVSLNSQAQMYDTELRFLLGKARRQLLGSVDGPDIAGAKFQAELTEEKLRVQVPALSDYIFTYDYTQPKSDYMIENFGSRLDDLDEMLKSLYEAKPEGEYNSDLIRTVIEEGKKLEFTKVDAEEFEVDEEDRKCNGIATTVTQECMQNILDEVEKVVRESQNGAYGYDGGYAGEYFDEIEKDLAEIEDVDVTFFIYKKKLACIRIEAKDTEAELRFLGGDTRMQNMQFNVGEEEVMRLEGQTVDSTEIRKLFVEGEEYLVLEYDRKDGDLDITADGGRTMMSGNIALEKDSFNVSVDRIMADGQLLDITCSMSVEKGASFEEIEGKEFDLGRAEQKDMEGLFLELNLL